MNTLSAPHLTLEPLVAEHAAGLYEALIDPAIYEFEGEPPPSLERLRAGLARREARRTPDGRTILDWAIRVQGGQLAGYVQATLNVDNSAYVSYELSSAFWRQGIGSSAVARMLRELQESYAVSKYVAVLKAANYRSLGLLRKLGFEPGTFEDARANDAGPDELTFVLEVAALRPMPPHSPANAA